MKNYYKLIFPILVLAILYSCVLNSTQEAALNQHLSHYLNAKKNCSALGIAGFSHPEYVKEVKAQGDSIFKATFECVESQRNLIFDATLRQSKAEGDEIHVFYELDAINQVSGSREKKVQAIVAISEDNGETWYFIPKAVYQNKEECKNIKRLIEIEF